MNKDTIKKIADLIEKTSDFEDTLNDMFSDELWVHTYHAFEVFDKVVVFSEFSNRIAEQRDFLIYDGESLRDSTSGEDAILRGYDDENPLREEEDIELTFIIARNPDNTISRGEPMKKCEFCKKEIDEGRFFIRDEKVVLMCPDCYAEAEGEAMIDEMIARSERNIREADEVNQ